MAIRKGNVLFRPEQFSLAKKSKIRLRLLKVRIKRIESRGCAINLCIDVGGYEFNLNEDLINNYQIGEHVTLYLYGKGCSIMIKKAERIVPPFI